MNYKCPACKGRHFTLADRRECMADHVRKKNRERLREAWRKK